MQKYSVPVARNSVIIKGIFHRIYITVLQSLVKWGCDKLLVVPTVLLLPVLLPCLQAIDWDKNDHAVS